MKLYTIYEDCLLLGVYDSLNVFVKDRIKATEKRPTENNKHQWTSGEKEFSKKKGNIKIKFACNNEQGMFVGKSSYIAEYNWYQIETNTFIG